eukprot:Rmarinus@m.29862
MVKSTIFAGAVLFGFISQAAAFGANCNREAEIKPTAFQEVPPNTKGAFFGDGGNSEKTESVLSMVKDWGAEFIVHSGDFDYDSNPQSWIDMLDRNLGPDFPYFATIGNHDMRMWDPFVKEEPGYEELLAERIERNNGVLYNCVGETAVKETCNYKGIDLFLDGIGVWSLGHHEYLEEALGSSESIWRVCNWHKNMRMYQTGKKFNECTYEVYEICRRHGAMIHTSHEHSYARTYTMSDFREHEIANKDDTIVLSAGDDGTSFAYVSGLGGRSVRNWEFNLNENEWWASCVAKDNGGTYGAMLCEFHVDNNPRLARCEFRDVNGVVWDQFDVYTTLPEGGEEGVVQFSTPAPKSSIIELQISDPSNDVELRGSEIRCDANAITLAHAPSFGEKLAASSAFRFEAVPLVSAEEIVEAHLQFYGVDGGESAHNVQIIRAEYTPNSAPFDCHSEQQPRTLTQASAIWTIDNGDDENDNNTVWTTVDVSEILREITAMDGWKENGAVTFVIEGSGDRVVTSYEDHPCLATSLIIEVAPKA